MRDHLRRVLPKCPSGTACIAGLTGQGACLKPLSKLGEVCDNATQRLCGQGLTCDAGHCATPCNPSDASLRTATTITTVFGVGSTSSDCSSDALCVVVSLTTAGNVFVCARGLLRHVGSPCDAIYDYCPFPFACQLIGDQLATSGVCSPADCMQTPCDSGAVCETFADSSGATRHLCIQPGSVPPGGLCAADTDCVASTSCASFGSGMLKTCK